MEWRRRTRSPSFHERTSPVIGARSKRRTRRNCQPGRSEKRRPKAGAIHLPGITHSYRFDFAWGVGEGGGGPARQAQFAVGSSARRPRASSSFWPAFPVSARLRSASVAAKSSADSNCIAANRSSRRCKATAQCPNRAMSSARPSACGAASAANRTTGKNDLRSKTRKLRLPPGFFVAGQFGHLRQMIAQPGIPGFQHGEAVRGGCDCA